VKILLVWNPKAGHGHAAALAAEAVGMFRAKGIHVDLWLTEDSGHAARIISKADFTGYDGLVAAGGDGTLCEVVNGYYANPARGNIPLGVLPVGTGNAFAHDLGANEGRWREAIEIIVADKRRRVDVGRFISGGRTFYFLNLLEIGFVADVVATAIRLKVFGYPPYRFGMLVHTLFLHSFPIILEADGRVIERENLFAEISNARGYTSHFLLAPQARLDDGLLDVTLLGKMDRLRFLRSAPLFFTGAHLSLPEVETFRACRLRISTQTPKVVCSDGELASATPVEVECLKQNLEVFGLGPFEENPR
jgi:diacylglycerol kinase (ATP)